MTMSYQQEFVLAGVAGRAAILNLTARHNRLFSEGDFGGWFATFRHAGATFTRGGTAAPPKNGTIEKKATRRAKLKPTRTRNVCGLCEISNIRKTVSNSAKKSCILSDYPGREIFSIKSKS